MEKNTLIIYTDGSSRGNPGTGGWGAIVASDFLVTELGGYSPYTTNNKMELAAAIAALDFTRKNYRDILRIDMQADSRYVINGITKWVYGWKKNGWLNSKKEEVLNRGLWEELFEITESIKNRGVCIEWNYTPGHSGISGNERADKIATLSADKKHPVLFSGNRSEYEVDLENKNGSGAKKTATKTKKKSATAAYSYVSLVDGKFMKHASWADCEARVKGARGAKFKKTMNAEDEKRIAFDWGAA